MIFRYSSCLCVLFLLPVLSTWSGEDVSVGTGIVLDPYIFTQASNFMNAADTNAQSAVIEKLRREYAERWEALVPQLLLFSFRSGDKKAMIGPTIVGLLNIPHEAFTKAVLPCLNSESKEFRSDLYDIMGHVDELPHRSPRDPDFAIYEEIIRGSSKYSTQGLIRYMFWKSPKNAVLSMARVYGDKPTETELADQLKGDPKAVLRSLAGRPEWWARLYVAETMKKQPQLRDLAILKKLEKDDNPLVRERVADITSGK